ncbi:hypothetical protein RBH94_14870 [Aestuariibaculum sp. YM273]|uniref:hypothetical protein n=1 Tax=Aestuariibaculum sp. YM273 TaxID=3070659 RepID=UPI0027DC7630|nr:hypothetical protein [Aestuariibaculum sp. YM273]WMI65333.1 hypothetical protein RBH94_14870 [Aestuariibaculum sp. YM273]
MRILKVVTLVLSSFILLSCSSDDNKEKARGIIVIGEDQFEVKSAFLGVSFGNTFIELSNKSSDEVMSSLSSGASLQGVDFMHFRINQASIGETTYNLNELNDFDFTVNGEIFEAEFEGGVTVLSKNDINNNLEANSGSITITYYSVDRIEFTFEFERKDGTTIYGSYNGEYTTIDNNNDGQ